MIRTKLTLMVGICLISLSVFPQKGSMDSIEYLLDQFKNSPEILDKLDPFGTERQRIKLMKEFEEFKNNEFKDSKQQSTTIKNSSPKKGNYNFSITEMLGPEDPMIKAAQDAEDIRLAKSILTSTSILSNGNSYHRIDSNINRENLNSDTMKELDIIDHPGDIERNQKVINLSLVLVGLCICGLVIYRYSIKS